MATVLVVESDPIYRKLFPIWIRDHFAPQGWQTITVSSAIEARDAAQRTRPGVLLIAFELEGDMDGLALAAQLTAGLEQARVVLISRTGFPRLCARLRRLPGAQFLAKPIGERTFVDVVDAALQAKSGAVPNVTPTFSRTET